MTQYLRHNVILLIHHFDGRSWIRTTIGIVILASLTFFSYCGRKAAKLPKEEILARVGDRVITVNEFIRRAEYTIRPPYCRQDNYIHRKIILNSLIAEKLLALEAAGKAEVLTRNEEFQAYIKGRQEQAMRQYFYYDRAYRQVKPDTAELKRLYSLAGRSYKVNFVRLPDANSAATFLQIHREKGVPFDDLARDIVGDNKIPEHQVNFNDDMSREFFNLFYAKPLQQGEIIGPVRLDDGTFMIMQVKGWTTQMAISDNQMRQRWDNVRERVTEMAAEDIYAREVGKLMRGKRLEFDKNTFYQLVEILAPLYLKNQKEKQDLFNQRYWGKAVEFGFDTAATQKLAALRARPFFQVDNQTWTVGDFERAVMSHPLVFRKNRFSSREFPEQFKYAVVDLVRDTYINRAAYRTGYDKLPVVKNYTAMWRDNLVAIYWRNEYLKGAGYNGNFGKEYMSVIRDYLNPYIDSLQKKYSDIIEINTDAFEKIKLTNIDMFVMQKGVAFPIVSPAFPILTTDNKLDYGRKMQAR